MADFQAPSLVDRDIDQAIKSLKKGAHLLKYGRRGKPKFCPFRLSSDESTLVWYYGKDEKQLELRQVTRIVPGQRTSVFQRYPRPEKEYQSFSLIYNDRSLDLICKDKDEAEVWFTGLKALLSRGGYKKLRSESRVVGSVLSDSPRCRRVTPSSLCFHPDEEDIPHPDNASQRRLGKAFSDIISYTAPPSKTSPLAESAGHSPTSHLVESSNSRPSGAETTFRVSLSSALSSSSQGSFNEDFDNLGDVFIFGEGTGNGVIGGGLVKVERASKVKIDALLPKALESTVVLDVHNIACGGKHAALVTKQGEIFSWGEEAGGRLGHGVESDVSHPKLIESLSGKSIEMVACGEYHTCAVTVSGDLYSWGDGSLNCGLLGHESEASHWIPKKVCGPIEGLHVSFVSCGPWHTALLTSAGRLFTFGDGSFGALGHGDRCGTRVPREVEGLEGLRTLKVACGVWHTAALVEVVPEASDDSEKSGQISGGKVFTWGDGDRGRLGHGDNISRLVPECIASLAEERFSHVACGIYLTVALTTSGRVYMMGSTNTVQEIDKKNPVCVGGNIADSFVEVIACGAHHVAVLTSKAEVYTWGKGTNGQLGHGDNDDRSTPTLVGFLKDKQVKSITCGSNYTAVICPHKWMSSADNSVCSGCHNPFNFIRKRHNCYNCGLVFCKACSNRKSLKASLAPSMNKPYRVCDDCFNKLQKIPESPSVVQLPTVRSNNLCEKESVIPRFISRLSSVESFKSDRSSSAFNVRFEGNESRGFPGNLQRPSSCSKSMECSSSPSSMLFSGPDSRMFPRTPSPLRMSEANQDDIRSSNDSLSQEAKSLRAQVEKLTSKSQLLEAELERKSKQLKEATARAADEAEKSKSAKEVIKSLTAQLKEIAEKVAEEQVIDSNEEITSGDSNEDIASGDTNGSDARSTISFKSESNFTPPLPNRTKPNSGSNMTSSISFRNESNCPPPLPNGTKSNSGSNMTTSISFKNESNCPPPLPNGKPKSERIVQDEPGVYLTLVSLPNGVNELRRVRFSRKRFTEDQAEKWWAENGDRVCERHDVKILQ